jgi:hypothetical protein
MGLVHVIIFYNTPDCTGHSFRSAHRHVPLRAAVAYINPTARQHGLGIAS